MMNIRNEEVREVVAEIPKGHKHLRTRIFLSDGTEITLQEATVANIARAYITIMTHPKISRLRLKGEKLNKRKNGFAEWQLLEQKKQ